jgi:hypothetical protein
MISNSHGQSVSPAFVARWEQILYNIKQFYLVAATRRVGANFEQDIGAVVVSNDDPELDDPIEIVRQLLPPDDRSMSRDEIERIPLAPMLVAATYCYRARQAVREGDHEQGWIYLVDAGYWCGLVRAGGSIRQAIHQAVDEAKGSVSRKGGAQRAKKFESVRQFACKMVLKKQPPLKGWKSKSHAARAIADVTVRFAKRKGIKMSTEEAPVTIGGWLGQMPEAHLMFSKNNAGGNEPSAG